MKISSVMSLDKRGSADIIVLPFWQGKAAAEAAFSSKEFSALLEVPLASKDFKGREAETLLVYNPSKKKEGRVLLLGLGPKDKCTHESLRRAYAAIVKACVRKKHKNVNVVIPQHEQNHGEVICEGILLANYDYIKLKHDSLKDEPSPFLDSVCFIGSKADAFKRIEKIVEAVNYTRDLVNGNADDTTPDALAAEGLALAKKYKSVKTTVLRKKELQKEKMGLLLAVCKGSPFEPALVVMEYRGDPKSAHTTAVVGKGITYDTGGLNIKPTGGMETMKCDMAGAGAVLGIIRAAAEIGLKANIIGVIASAENAVGPNSYKPGDVYRSHSGKTVEIANTDAEGRLVLADALSYLLAHYSPSRVIDMATLTGGIVVALGEEMTGLFSNDDALAKGLIAAGLTTHERLWRMPLLSEYHEPLKSSIADIRNSGGRKSASSGTAAAFLQKFIKKPSGKEESKEIPWAHLDIAGTAYLSEPKHYHQTPATGVGVRLLIEFLSK